MRNRTGILLGVAAVFAVAAFANANAGPEFRTPWGKSAPRRDLSFSVSGSFSGILSGDIELAGVMYHLAPGVQLYELGVGPMEFGTPINDRFVFLTGTRAGDSAVINSIIVRPEREGSGQFIPPTISDGSKPQ